MGNPKKYYKARIKTNVVSEQAEAYHPIEKGKIPFHVFGSFEEMNVFESKEKAALTCDQRMENIEILRKQVFYRFLLPHGKWRPVAKVFKIMEPYVSKIIQ